ncbi:MAG: hypothetical protein PHU77_00685 [Simplicispira sp.]|nr:hypothetical protein [Simplicispira sp.]
MTVKKNFSQLVAAAVVLAASALSTPAALAHGGADALHGGVVQTAADLSFELVATADGALIYLQDHGKDADAAGFDGKLTVLQGAEKSEAPLKSAGGNKLEAKGIALAKGAKAVATLSTSSKKTITVRFTVK